jgi:cytochrome c-type biogenesis protein CcmH/NrfG
MNDLELIDDYFSGRLSADERLRFETSLKTDSALAEAVAFYLTARQAAQAEVRANRKARFETLREEQGMVRQMPVSTIIALAASVLLILGLGGYWLFQLGKPSASELADRYIQENFSQLSLKMDGQSDSLQTGIKLYNAGKLKEAALVFNAILQSDPGNDRALQFAGIVSLRTGQYHQAINQFHQLSERTDLFANPGVFLEAVTRLKRLHPTDKTQAEVLLKTVIGQNLEGKAEAEKLIEAL